MEVDQERRVAGLLLFFLGGVTGTFLALRLARREQGTALSTTGVQALLDETVGGVESAAAYVRTLVEPIHELLDEAGALASGVRRTVDTYRHIGQGQAAAAAARPESAIPS
jgi:hypothetical protein